MEEFRRNNFRLTIFLCPQFRAPPASNRRRLRAVVPPDATRDLREATGAVGGGGGSCFRRSIQRRRKPWFVKNKTGAVAILPLLMQSYNLWTPETGIPAMQRHAQVLPPCRCIETFGEGTSSRGELLHLGWPFGS